MLKPLHHGISVPDADASALWYEDIFGFRKKSDEFIPPLNTRIVFLEKDGFELELFQYMGEDGKPLPPDRLTADEDLKTCGTKHVAYAVEDLPALYAELVAKGVTVVRPLAPMNEDLMCFIRDNSDILLELIQPGGAK